MSETYFKINRRLIKADIEKVDGNRLAIDFKFDEQLKDEIKISCSNPRFDWGNKVWTVQDDFRTKVSLAILRGEYPFGTYDKPLVDFTPTRKLYAHQVKMAQHCLTRRYGILAAEMGTGKTLVAIETMEQSGLQRFWYIAPRSALESVKYELSKWGAKVVPQLMTYEEMVRILSGWDNNCTPPQGVWFDESSKIKNPTAKRTQAAIYLADHIREYYGEKGMVILMSGSPAPKSPLDWWSQCEVAYPGFIREGSVEKFRDRIALMKQEENISGIKYPKLVTFRDNTKKCNICGKLEDHIVHQTDPVSVACYVPDRDANWEPHNFVPMKDEISIMHKRMEGLVLVQFKKDCLDLPEKIYRKIELKPDAQTLRLAKLIKKSQPTVAQALIQLRELSDGFQYHEKLIGTTPCENCFCAKAEESTGRQTYVEINDDGTEVVKERDCIHCAGKKCFKKFEVTTVECDTPKVKALQDILESKEEDGRLIVFGGFTGSIDRICATVKSNKFGGKAWNYIRVDGRGWHSDLGTNDPQKLLKIFQEQRDEFPNICFVGHPGSAGMGLTLTASDTIVYYSNDFNAESRIQSEDRIHRPGSRGCIIIDLVHLPIDDLIIENLSNKRDLMKITMGDLNKVFGDNDGE